MGVVAIQDILNYTSFSEIELSERLHEDRRIVSSWYKGEASPTIMQLRKILNVIKSKNEKVVEVPAMGIDITPLKLMGFLLF